ncbi:hypothetical protein R1sor_013711 [Riccia sorocarpa]|uniref:Rhodanese domain-containing protein n=1 Tax=Riccia sorocarpa TaxID=122646 RepID=A0ABD3HAB2_9MARC
MVELDVALDQKQRKQGSPLNLPADVEGMRTAENIDSEVVTEVAARLSKINVVSYERATQDQPPASLPSDSNTETDVNEKMSLLKKDDEPQLEQRQLDQERRKVALEKYAGLRAEFFPEVPDISGEELLDLMKNDAVGNSVILIDCRSEAERQASMYKGAVTIEEFEANAEYFKEKEIVAYCAIGRRSGMFLKKLMERYPGIRVRNHAGSMVDWAHVGGPLVEQKTQYPTNRIHPNGTWVPYLPLTRNLQVVGT